MPPALCEHSLQNMTARGTSVVKRSMAKMAYGYASCRKQ